MSTNEKIGILTGGGDVPGLNPVIKSVVYGGSEIRRPVVGIRKGWAGLTYMTSAEDPTYIRELTRENTRAIDRTGGTVLHTSRTNPRKVPESKLPNDPAARTIVSDVRSATVCGSVVRRAKYAVRTPKLAR